MNRKSEVNDFGLFCYNSSLNILGNGIMILFYLAIRG